MALSSTAAVGALETVGEVTYIHRGGGVWDIATASTTFDLSAYRTASAQDTKTAADVSAAITGKADTTTVNAALASKANTSDVATALALKANTSAVDALTTTVAGKLDDPGQDVALADASNISGRLGATASQVTDWNAATASGWYWSAADAANRPVDAIVLGVVEKQASGYLTQTVHEVIDDGEDDTRAWRRSLRAGVWSPWYRILISQAEMDARYLGGSIKATAAQVNAGVNDVGSLTTKRVYDALAELVFLDGATITLDLSAATNFRTTLRGNRVLAAPLNQVRNKSGRIVLQQDVTGGRTLTLDDAWKLAGGGSVLTTSSGRSIAVSSISNASPAVITTAAAHNLRKGQVIAFMTTGVLPTGLGTSGLYYVVAVPSSTTLQVASTINGSPIGTSSAGSGTHTIKTCPTDVLYYDVMDTNFIAVSFRGDIA